MKPFRQVGETARERETLLYATYLLHGSKHNSTGTPIPSSQLRTSRDATLTALAQLGAIRTRTDRSLISLFDEDFQHIVAETTTTTRLASDPTNENHGEPLWLCGSAIPRKHGVCDYTVCGQDPDGLNSTDGGPYELPLTKVEDLGASSTFSSKPYCKPGSPAKFYAAVPIRTKRGINIGVYCVIHNEPVLDWSVEDTQVLRDIAQIIMDHFEAKRDYNNHRRSVRMHRGIGSFLEDKATLSDWRDGSFPGAFTDVPGLEGSLNSRQQAAQAQGYSVAKDTTQDTTPTGQIAPGQQQQQQTQRQAPRPGSLAAPKQPQYPLAEDSIRDTNEGPAVLVQGNIEDTEDTPLEYIFSKAANIMRESMETEGCLFVNPTSKAFGSFPDEGKEHASKDGLSQSPSPSSDDMSAGAEADDTQISSCEVLGFSTSNQHSVNGDADAEFRGKLAQKLVAALCRRYPRGHIFNFDSRGGLLSSDSSDDHAKSPLDEPQRLQTPRARHSHRSKPWSRENEAASILQVFPGAYSVAFMPIWDPKKERWLAGEFVYTNTKARSFSSDTELSFMMAFGMVIAETTLRHEILRADKAKSDALSCISHELRSPLHGILLSVELLNETILSVFQGNVSHTIETCSRTLADTLDHLLDYSKINNFSTTARHRNGASRARGLRQGTKNTVSAGMMSLTSTVNLSVLAEEVIESVFAGFYFQHMSVRQLAVTNQSKFHDAWSNSKMDSMRAMEDFESQSISKPCGPESSLGNPSVFLLIDPHCHWRFHIESGALRRIIMNLFGNALKYTKHGSIKVSLAQIPQKTSTPQNSNQVILTVTDTGIGMSKEYLDNYLFQPFSQEDSLSPGTGLGLSIVKRIVSQLHGRISVKSQLGIGTTITVTLPMRAERRGPGHSNLSESSAKEFKDDLAELRGLRVCLVGFNTSYSTAEDADIDEHGVTSISMLRSVCREWLKLDVVEEAVVPDVMPDLVILSENSLAMWQQHQHLSEVPAVVVCQNALLAYQHTNGNLRKKLTKQTGVLEFISQPIGPQKLAKSLRLIFNRWRDWYSDSSNQSDVSSPFSETLIPDSDWTAPETPPSTESSLSDASNGDPAHIPVIQEPSARPDLAHAALVPNRPKLSRSVSRNAATFLLVDDNAINLRILSTYISKLKGKFRTATNGQEAVDAYKIAPRECKCVFMDISMPVMDGLAATRAIRSYERAKKVQPALIVALTGLASAENQQEAFSSGVDLFLTKPVKLKELSAILKSRELLEPQKDQMDKNAGETLARQ